MNVSTHQVISKTNVSLNFNLAHFWMNLVTGNKFEDKTFPCLSPLLPLKYPSRQPLNAIESFGVVMHSLAPETNL